MSGQAFEYRVVWRVDRGPRTSRLYQRLAWARRCAESIEAQYGDELLFVRIERRTVGDWQFGHIS